MKIDGGFGTSTTLDRAGELVGALSARRLLRQALPAARKVAQSQLVKCSWYGKDPYWGRIASELGSAATSKRGGRRSASR